MLSTWRMIMKKLILNNKLRFRLENVDNENIIFCYDERINEYFAMDAKYFEALKLLENGIIEKDFISACNNINPDLLIRGLKYRKLIIETEGE